MSSCETRKRSIENTENGEKKRKVKEISEEISQQEREEHCAWNDDVTNCILESWLNENSVENSELAVFVDTCSLENESVSCADFDEESTFQDNEVCNASSTVMGCDAYEEESEEEICAGTVLASKEECDFDTGSECEISESDDEDEKSERKVLILDLDNTLIHCARESDGELEIQLPESSKLTQEAMQLHNLEEVLESPKESVLDGLQHLYYVEASKINHVEGDNSLYVFKLRPGVIDFLRACSHMFELAICTMGTADYALWVKAMLERASGVEFTAGVLSREDSFNVAGQKCFDSAWPEESAVIVDDRKDVWGDYERNLIQIHPFLFFGQQGAENNGLSLKETMQLLGELHQTTLQDPSQDVRDVLEIIS
jgi:hypothetical protein